MKRACGFLVALVLATAMVVGTAHMTPSSGRQSATMLCPPAC